MERLTEFPGGEDAQSPTVFELNLTVIDLHVLRSAVHLINVVADLFFISFSKRDISQLFTNRQVNFTTEKVQKTGLPCDIFIVVCHQEGFFDETEVG